MTTFSQVFRESQSNMASIFRSLFVGTVLLSSYAIAEVNHTLGVEADVRFDFQTAIDHECPNFSIKHGARPFLSVDFNLDGVPDPFIFYNCVRRGEELVHPYYYVGPDLYVLVMLSHPNGTFANGNSEIFGQEKVTAGYFGFVGFELRDHAYDLNGDGYKDFVYHVWRDGLFQAFCYTRESQQDTERCSDENPDLLPEARWNAQYNQEGRYQQASGQAFATRGILLSNGDGTYDAKIIATGQDNEPGGGVSVFKDSEGYWTIWVRGPYFGAGSYYDEIEKKILPAPNSDVPLHDGTVLPTPGPKVYRFEDGEMLDVTSEYFLTSTKGVEDLGPYCMYEKAVAEKLAEQIEATGFTTDDCRVWDNPRFGLGFQFGIEYIPLTDNPSAVVTWSGVTNKSFLTRNCNDQPGKICAAPNDMDESFGERFEVPVLRAWKLRNGYGWVEQWSDVPENSMTVIPTPYGIFWRIFDEDQWGYSKMDRPNGFLEKVKLTPESPYEYFVYTCCRNAVYLKKGIEPESLGTLALENLKQKLFERGPWTAEDCPSFLWGVEPSHCSSAFAWRHMLPSPVFAGAPDDLYTIWLEAGCNGAEDGSEAFEACLEGPNKEGLLEYRNAATKTGFDHVSFAFDATGRVQPKNYDPVAGLARNASNYELQIADVNGDGLDDFIAGTYPWFNGSFLPWQRQGYSHPRLIVGINDGAFGFSEATTYWPELVGMNSFTAAEASTQELEKRLVDYDLGNWYPDLNQDGVADLLLFDHQQYGLALNGMPEVAISYAVVSPDESTPNAPVILDGQFEGGVLNVRLASLSDSNYGAVTYFLTCTNGIDRYQASSSKNILTLNGLDYDASFQCSAQIKTANGGTSPSTFATTGGLNAAFNSEAPDGLPISLIYGAINSQDIE